MNEIKFWKNNERKSLWETFFHENKNYTAEQVLEFARELAKKYGFDLLF